LPKTFLSKLLPPLCAAARGQLKAFDEIDTADYEGVAPPVLLLGSGSCFLVCRRGLVEALC
jgi:hypothetical protein